MTDVSNAIPAFDYEAAKDFYFDKLQADRTGKGRMESALFHTAQYIFAKGCHRQAALLARIAELETRVDHLQRLTPLRGYTAEELEIDNPYNTWLHE